MNSERMRQTFKRRLYPTRQQRRLEPRLQECRWNVAGMSLECRWMRLPALKAARPSLANMQSQVLQNVAVRIDLAFQAFFRRCRAGENPGYPRFRGIRRYDSMS